MKNISIIIIIAILISCGNENKSESIDSNNQETVEVLETSKKVEIPTNIITYFIDFTRDSVKIEVEQYTQERSFEPSDCLPLAFLPLLDNKIPQTQAESTGAKPVGKLKVNDNNYFLVVVQQDDYGPIYYGLMYNSQENRIENSEKIAETWGDAGDSQVTYSIIWMMNETVNINKYIETCHADLVVQGDEMIAKDVECSDSTATIEMKIKN
ncbi:MAG: hypothetical protein CL843_06735 [Crocinitomicaceae bacterium]|nr:hypothetical protein [Crocinitomicaceae bacterium]|tara:strand:- start:2673 stop:3305 length:633 start_codon:yes stop_codon:yes gene_type:complete